MAKGAVAGRALNTIGELAMRLDMAKENLSAPLARANAHRDQMGVLAQRALAKEESALRLHERSRQAAEQDMDRREAASLPPRARGRTRLGLIPDGLACRAPPPRPPPRTR